MNKPQCLFSGSSHSGGEVLDNSHLNKQLAVLSEMIRLDLGGAEATNLRYGGQGRLLIRGDI